MDTMRKISSFWIAAWEGGGETTISQEGLIHLVYCLSLCVYCTASLLKLLKSQPGTWNKPKFRGEKGPSFGVFI